jgi:hypothetical protein
VPLGISPLHSREPVQEVSTALPLLDSTGAKMLKLEEVICNQLEAEGHVLAKKVTKHMLTCFRSPDPIVYLDPVVLGPVAGTEEAASCGVQDATKIVATRFSACQRTHKDPIVVFVFGQDSCAL